jgi:hypothetical protein
MQEDGTMSLRLWEQWTWVYGSLNPLSLSLSIYGDDHVIDDKGKYRCHALMITL